MVANSPRDYRDETFIFFQDELALRDTKIEHFHSIMSERRYDNTLIYKWVHFDLMGQIDEVWAEQLNNDLENHYLNESLQIIGCYSVPENSSEFSCLMYKTSDKSDKKEFDLEVKMK